MSIKGRWVRGSLLVLLITGVIVFPAVNVGLPLQAAEPIKLGEFGPLSPPGGYAEGQLMKNAAEVATEEINSQGGLLGRPVVVSYQDDRGLPEEGTAIMQRLATQEHVVAAFGGFHSSAFLAEMEVAHKYGIPIIGADVGSDKITGTGYPEVFRITINFSLEFVTIANWMAAAGFKNIAYLYEKTDAGENARRVIEPILHSKGIKYTIVSADLNTTDFDAQILRFKANTPPYDLFFLHFAGAGAGPGVSQAHQRGFAPTRQTGMYESGGPAVDPTFWNTVGQAGVGLVTELVGLPKSAWNPTTKRFIAEFTKKFKIAPPPAAIENYDAEWIIAEAIKRAGSTERGALIQALEKTDWVGGRGRYTFSTSHDPAWAYHQFMNAPMAIVQYTKLNQTPEDAAILFPKNVATVPYVYKQP